MGTTKTAITAGDNPVLAFVLAIEGHVTVYTTWNDTAAVVTAWAGGDFSAALRGLQVPGTMQQSIVPFRPRIETNTVAFEVFPEDTDALAEEIFAKDKASGLHTFLAANVAANATTVTGTATAAFPSSGSIYIGTERITYTGNAANAFTGCVRGTASPFAVDGGTRIGRAHRLSQSQGETTSRPEITNYARTWVGRWAGCWVHRVVDGVLDLKSAAELIWHGRIADIQDSESGSTILSCTDTRDAVASKMLMGDRWSAAPQKGVVLTTADFVTVEEHTTVSGTTTRVYTQMRAGDSPGVGTGLQTIEDIITGLSEWLQDVSVSGSSPALGGKWYMQQTATMVAFNAEFDSITLEDGDIIVTMSREFAGMLGFDIENPTGFLSNGHHEPWYIARKEDGTNAVITLMGTFPRAHTLLNPRNGTSLTYEGASGVFIDQNDTIPEPWRSKHNTTGGGSWGFVKWRDKVFLAKDSGTALTLYWDATLHSLVLTKDPAEVKTDFWWGIGADNDLFIRINTPDVKFAQIVIMQADLDDYLLKTFASTGASTYNHATNDVYDYQLGIGIPYSLLSTTFEQTAAALANRTDDKQIVVMIDKPTKFSEVLLPELVLRNAHLVDKLGTLAFVSPTVTDAASAAHAISTSHRVAKPDSAADEWPEVTLSRSTVITDIKVEYDRDINGKYRSTLEITNEQARSDFGQASPITVKARNAIPIERSDPGSTVRRMAGALAADALHFHSRPRPIVRRSISADKWFMTPGDSVDVTDDFVRSVTTGQRGIANVPSWALSVSRNWREMVGDVSLMLHDDESARLATYSPAGKLDEAMGDPGWSAGYNSSGPYIQLKANEFSLSADADDVTHFDTGDAIDIIAKSPSNPASATRWSRTVADVLEVSGVTVLQLNATLTLPTYDAALEYYVFSDAYGSAQATQKIHAFIGDDGDGKVLDTVRNFIYSTQELTDGSIAGSSTTARHEFATTGGNYEDDGRPCQPASHRGAIRSVQNLMNRRTAPHAPIMQATGSLTASTSYVMCAFPIPVYIGNSTFGVEVRELNLAPILKISTAGVVTVRCTTSSIQPSGTSATVPVFRGAVSQKTFSSASTATRGENVAAGVLPVNPVEGQPYTWFTVELKTTAGNGTWLGFHEFWLGPLDFF